MAQPGSKTILRERKAAAGDGYRAQVVFAFRQFELDNSEKAAARQLLDLIPKDDDQRLTLLTLGDALCDSETISEMKSLARVRDGLPQEFARAVLLLPTSMPAYLSYSLKAVADPHDDSAIQMQVVCRKAHGEFLRAFDALPVDDKSWYRKYIFDPEDCRALEHPEAR